MTDPFSNINDDEDLGTEGEQPVVDPIAEEVRQLRQEQRDAEEALARPKDPLDPNRGIPDNSDLMGNLE